MMTRIDVPNLKGVAEAQSPMHHRDVVWVAHFQAGPFITLRAAFEEAISESEGRIEVRPGFLSGKPKLVGNRLGVDDILYTLADTLSFEKTREELNGLDLDDIQTALDFAAAVCGREV